jgi:hypothetical protein
MKPELKRLRAQIRERAIPDFQHMAGTQMELTDIKLWCRKLLELHVPDYGDMVTAVEHLI